MHRTYRKVDTLADIFNSSEKSKLNKSICLTSPPGTGKTSFVKHLTLTWCKAHSSSDDNDAVFTAKNKEIMKQFEFAFLLTLRDVKGECDQDEMIHNLLTSQLPSEYKGFDKIFLQAILQREKCLVIMDGLDEWSHPKAKTKSCKQGLSNFPHRKVRTECSLLFTTRPWTFTNVKREHINTDCYLEMPGLGIDSSIDLVGNVINYLNKHTSGEKMLPDKFLQMLSRKGLQKFQSNPVMLMQLICVWFERQDLGESQCEIYVNMLELLFRRAELEVHIHAKRRKHQLKLPLIFSNSIMCNRNAKLLLSLGKLSFATLFRGRKESLLIFDKTDVLKYMEEADLMMCLRAGILTQNEQCGLTKEIVNITFLHKTFQEFFAALHLTTRYEQSENTVKVFENHNSLGSILHLETVLAFVCGFSHQRFSKLTEKMQDIVSKDQFIKQYGENIGTLFLENRDYVMSYCHMVTKAVKETIVDFEFETVYLEDIYIDEECTDEKYADVLGRVIEINENNIKSLVIDVKQKIIEENIEKVMERLHVGCIISLEKLLVWGEIPHNLLQTFWVSPSEDA